VGRTFADVTPAVSTPAYEGFDYSPGVVLNGNNGGTGFSGPWAPGGFNASLHDNYDIAAGSLTFGSLQVSGNRVHSPAVNAIAGLTRPLSPCVGTPGTTRYFSFLLRPEDTLDAGIFNGFFGLILHQPSANPELFIGKPGGGAVHDYVLENRGGANQVASGVQVEVGKTAFLVIKAQFTESNDTFTLYMNPTPGCPEPGQGIVKQDIDNGIITELTIYSSGEFSMDELRVGNTFADVTPVAATPLTLTCPDDLVLQCGQDNTAAIAAWLSSATCSGGCGPCQVTHDYAGLSEGDCGTATVTFTATDECCGMATCSRTITVIWNFAGFFKPVENPPVFNRVKAGRGIPVRFSLGGDQGLAIFASGYPASVQIPCDFSSPTVPLNDTVAAGSDSLSYDPASDTYTYIWRTDRAWAGTCRALILKLADGTLHYAYFSFTR
jgi:hypothetical protein